MGGCETVDCELDEDLDPLDSSAILTFFFFYSFGVLSDEEPPAFETEAWESVWLNIEGADFYDNTCAIPTPFFFSSSISSSIISIWFL